jgi:glyoxylase-like metal-dependent hydrolase (beta-lactamase superfamily II)
VSNTTLAPGVCSALSPLVRRIVAPNPGPMTGPGTNSYLVGIDEVAVLDPGPADKGHVDAIVGAAMVDRVRWVVLTHTHPDHWPAAKRIKEKTGAEIVGHPKIPKPDGDISLDRRLGEGDTIDGTEFQLTALHTPGHAPNHLCFLLEEERVLFTGDHVLAGTTTVVNPQRGGDMVEYLASLERLRSLRRIQRICPAHGDVLDEPKAVLDEYVTHRLMREKQVLGVLREGPAKIDDVAARLYPDVDERLEEMARHQVHAHLLKLRGEGKVEGRSRTSTWKLA